MIQEEQRVIAEVIAIDAVPRLLRVLQVAREVMLDRVVRQSMAYHRRWLRLRENREGQNRYCGHCAQKNRHVSPRHSSLRSIAPGLPHESAASVSLPRRIPSRISCGLASRNESDR